MRTREDGRDAMDNELRVGDLNFLRAQAQRLQRLLGLLKSDGVALHLLAQGGHVAIGVCRVVLHHVQRIRARANCQVYPYTQIAISIPHAPESTTGSRSHSRRGGAGRTRRTRPVP